MQQHEWMNVADTAARLGRSQGQVCRVAKQLLGLGLAKLARGNGRKAHWMIRSDWTPKGWRPAIAAVPGAAGASSQHDSGVAISIELHAPGQVTIRLFGSGSKAT